MTEQFTWIPIYQELATELAKWQDKQSELIQFLEDLREKEYVITPLMDKDKNGAIFLYKEIDPFTFFGVFNRGIRQDQRVSILVEIKKFFNLKSEIPTDFDGIPILNNMKSIFFSRQFDRDVQDVARLWRVFSLALEDNPLDNEDFLKAFNDALKVKWTNVNLTMGLFWIRPYTFLNLDQLNRLYFDIKLPATGLSSKFYKETLDKLKTQGKTHPELSLLAWEKFHEPKPPESPKRPIHEEGIDYWLVGAYWNDQDPPDQTPRLLDEGLWENGYEDRYLDDVKSMKVGDKIAIKSSSTQRNNLPFDNRNNTVSKMDIKAVGTVVANRGDGRSVEVEWETDFKERTWYFYTNRYTIWHLNLDPKYKWAWMVQDLIDFVWHGKEQTYEKFTSFWWDKSSDVTEGEPEPYSIEDMIASGVFLSGHELVSIVDRLREKKAIIIQGAPGVGKTFIARKLAFALMEEQDKQRVKLIQFHQSYSYDDFVRGYRPLPGQAGTFGLQNGIFFDFCEKARNDPDREYIFIIDEINRGNLSQIFGELLMLIETDKRGKESSVPLVYRKEDEPEFYIPGNVYLVGLMNLADRSLAMVDYALRRRFSFITLKPQFESDIFRKWLEDRSMNVELIDLIINKMSALNKVIREDSLLGENYQVGHSYFCPKGDNFEGLTEEWYKAIVDKEIIPLLKEYWFDNAGKVSEVERSLKA
jgi:5-methylcytosine-specific restriction protein B